jgi:hypothetical protein
MWAVGGKSEGKASGAHGVTGPSLVRGQNAAVSCASGCASKGARKLLLAATDGLCECFFNLDSCQQGVSGQVPRTVMTYGGPLCADRVTVEYAVNARRRTHREQGESAAKGGADACQGLTTKVPPGIRSLPVAVLLRSSAPRIGHYVSPGRGIARGPAHRSNPGAVAGARERLRGAHHTLASCNSGRTPVPRTKLVIPRLEDRPLEPLSPFPGRGRGWGWGEAPLSPERG